MPDENVYRAAAAAFSLYGGFFKDVVQETSLERAVSLHAKQGEAFDAMLVGMIRERLGGKELDLRTFACARAEALEVLGMTAQVEEAPGSVTIGVQNCPLYDGLRMAGVEHDTIEAMCRRGVDLGYAKLAEAFPRLSGCLKFRAAPDQPCVEEFAFGCQPG
jgi:hypothetical protein